MLYKSNGASHQTHSVSEIFQPEVTWLGELAISLPLFQNRTLFLVVLLNFWFFLLHHHRTDVCSEVFFFPRQRCMFMTEISISMSSQIHTTLKYLYNSIYLAFMDPSWVLGAQNLEINKIVDLPP